MNQLEDDDFEPIDKSFNLELSLLFASSFLLCNELNVCTI